MTAYDFVHLALHALDDPVKGKTKFQKTVYFLGIMTDRLDDLGYRAHFYGPYSPEVAAAMDRLRALGFVDQTVASGGAVDARGFEVARYDYCLNERGKEIAAKKAQRDAEMWEGLRNAVARLKNAGDPDYVKLSVAAKTYFMLGRHDGKASMTAILDLASRFGWSVSKAQVTDAVGFLGSMQLVAITT